MFAALCVCVQWRSRNRAHIQIWCNSISTSSRTSKHCSTGDNQQWVYFYFHHVKIFIPIVSLYLRVHAFLLRNACYKLSCELQSHNSEFISRIFIFFCSELLENKSELSDKPYCEITILIILSFCGNRLLYFLLCHIEI